MRSSRPPRFSRVLVAAATLVAFTLAGCANFDPFAPPPSSPPPGSGADANREYRIGVPDLSGFFRFFTRCNTRLKSILLALLGRTGNRDALPFLTTILLEEFFVVRTEAARALGMLDDPRAIAPLLLAQRNDPSEEVRHVATLALKRLNAYR